MTTGKPMFSFCISTFRRPGFLKEQLKLLLNQTFRDFEIVISDNDPVGSGREVCVAFNDPRIRYFSNGDNIGMIPSFNKSIERADGEFVVMVTDDDPIQPGFLNEIKRLVVAHPGHSLYGGFFRKGIPVGATEVIAAKDTLEEILDPDRSSNILWSSCVLRREDVLAIGAIADYGSPHLADHALLVMTASEKGAVIVNKMFSSLSKHDNNFSKFNFDYYYEGCKGFYETFNNFQAPGDPARNKKAIEKHLGVWLIANMFALKKYYTFNKQDKNTLKAIDECARQILTLPYMKQFRGRFLLKEQIFKVKKLLWKLK
jgi:glycosyltransferase involved in cell wall biosynthesis